MKTHLVATVLIAFLSLSATADTPDPNIHQRGASSASFDAIQASFLNMLNHEPYAGPTAGAMGAGVTLPAEEQLNATILADGPAGVTRSAGTYDENIAASFGRMLDGELYFSTTTARVALPFENSTCRLSMER